MIATCFLFTDENSLTCFWHLYIKGGLHYRMTLRTVSSDRDIRTRLTGFRVDLGTSYVTVCVLQEGVGGSFQQYFYNRYKILHTCQNLFDWFSRWPWNTLRNRMYVAGRSGGKLSAVFLQPIDWGVIV
jgi:hypothetical protein